MGRKIQNIVSNFVVGALTVFSSINSFWTPVTWAFALVFFLEIILIFFGVTFDRKYGAFYTVVKLNFSENSDFIYGLILGVINAISIAGVLAVHFVQLL